MDDQEREIRELVESGVICDEPGGLEVKYLLSLLDQERARWRAHRAICEARVNDTLELRRVRAQLTKLSKALKYIERLGTDSSKSEAQRLYGDILEVVRVTLAEYKEQT